MLGSNVPNFVQVFSTSDIHLFPIQTRLQRNLKAFGHHRLNFGHLGSFKKIVKKIYHIRVWSYTQVFGTIDDDHIYLAHSIILQ